MAQGEGRGSALRGREEGENRPASAHHLIHVDPPIPTGRDDPPQTPFLSPQAPLAPINTIHRPLMRPFNPRLERPLPPFLGPDPHPTLRPWTHPTPFLPFRFAQFPHRLRGALGISTPNENDEVIACRGEVLAAGGEGDGPDCGRVGSEGFDAGPFVVVGVGGVEFYCVVVGG